VNLEKMAKMKMADDAPKINLKYPFKAVSNFSKPYEIAILDLTLADETAAKHTEPKFEIFRHELFSFQFHPSIS
jgi:hypothetical protein